LVDHLFVFGANGQIKDFPGNYTQYRINKLKNDSSRSTLEVKDYNKDTRVSRQKVGLTYKEQKELEQLELEIDQLEAKKTLLLDQMNSGNMESLELINASKEFDQIEKDLELKTDRWLELSEKT